MLTKLTFPHEVKKKFEQYMEIKVKNSPLAHFVKSEVIFKDELPSAPPSYLINEEKEELDVAS
jgi:hypothetical protein